MMTAVNNDEAASIIQKQEIRIAALEAEVYRLHQQLNGVGVDLLAPPPQTSTKNAANVTIQVDPLISCELTALRQKLYKTETQLQDLKENAQLTTFTSEGPLGKRLLDKCRQLMSENEQLGEALLSSQIATLDNGVTIQAERDRFLLNQIKAIHGYNQELEAEIVKWEEALVKAEDENQMLRSDNEHLKEKLERLMDRDRRAPAPARGQSPSVTRRRDVVDDKRRRQR